MAVNVNAKIRKLSPAQRKRIDARAAKLAGEEITLRELRRTRKLTDRAPVVLSVLSENHRA